MPYSACLAPIHQTLKTTAMQCSQINEPSCRKGQIHGTMHRKCPRLYTAYVPNNRRACTVHVLSQLRKQFGAVMMAQDRPVPTCTAPQSRMGRHFSPDATNSQILPGCVSMLCGSYSTLAYARRLAEMSCVMASAGPHTGPRPHALHLDCRFFARSPCNLSGTKCCLPNIYHLRCRRCPTAVTPGKCVARCVAGQKYWLSSSASWSTRSSRPPSRCLRCSGLGPIAWLTMLRISCTVW